MLPDGLVGALRQAPARFVGLVAAERLPRFDGARERLPDLVEHIAQPGLGIGVLGERAGSGRMADVALTRFLENAVIGYGEADDAPEVFLR